MAKSTAMTVRLKPEVREKLDALARDTKRSTSHLASEAIESYVNLNAWQVAHIKAALSEDEVIERMALAGPRRHRLRRAGRGLRSVMSDGRSAGTTTEFFGQAFAGKSRRACFLEKALLARRPAA